MGSTLLALDAGLDLERNFAGNRDRAFRFETAKPECIVCFVGVQVKDNRKFLLLVLGRGGHAGDGKPGKVERAGVEMDGDRLAGGDVGVKSAGDLDFIGVLARAPGGDSKIVGGGTAVVGSLGEDLGLVGRGRGAVGEHVELCERAERKHGADKKHGNSSGGAIVEMRVGLGEKNGE